MGDPCLLCLSTQPQESECSRDRVLFLSYFSKQREPNQVLVQGAGSRIPRKAGQGQASHLPLPCWALSCATNQPGVGFMGDLRSNDSAPNFARCKKITWNTKIAHTCILCTKCFTICPRLLRSWFSFEPHLGCIRRWNVITFTLNGKRVLGLSEVTQLINSSWDLNSGLFVSLP